MAYFGEIRCDQTGEVLESTSGEIKKPYITIRGSVAVQKYSDDGRRWLEFLTAGPNDRLVFRDPEAAAAWLKTKLEQAERGELPQRQPRFEEAEGGHGEYRPRPRPYGAGPRGAPHGHGGPRAPYGAPRPYGAGPRGPRPAPGAPSGEHGTRTWRQDHDSDQGGIDRGVDRGE
jgi:hypothetical protein